VYTNALLGSIKLTILKHSKQLNSLISFCTDNAMVFTQKYWNFIDFSIFCTHTLSERYLWKFVFLFRGFLIIQTTFSYFPWTFENPATDLKTSWKRNIIFLKTNQKYYKILIRYECAEKLSITIGCNIWVICLELNLFLTIRVECSNYLNL